MKLFRNICFAALLLASIFTVHAEGYLGLDGEESTSIGIYIKDLKTGEVLVDHNSQLALTPASVMKAITTATALSINGADARFTTPVSLRGSKGQAGTWNGDLVIHSCGDPTIESENFKSYRGFCDSIVAGIKRLGIKTISGNIKVEQRLKDSGPILQWECEDIPWPYGAGLYGFNWRDNTVTVYPVKGTCKPAAPGFEIQLIKTNSGNDLVRGLGSNQLKVYARSPKPDWALKATVPDPSAVFVNELQAKLRTAGVELGKRKNTQTASTEQTIYKHRSAPYGEIMRSLMVRSDNLFAEGMLRSIAPDGTRKSALQRQKEIWATRGVNPRYTIINDGSGLTRANRLSARFIGDVLEWMAQSPMADTYTSFFPKAGKEGTMRGFLSKSPLSGKIALKTGSVSSVQCYAGYKLDDNGKASHVVVILVNGFFCKRPQVREGAENLLTEIFK